MQSHAGVAKQTRERRPQIRHIKTSTYALRKSPPPVRPLVGWFGHQLVTIYYGVNIAGTPHRANATGLNPLATQAAHSVFTAVKAPGRAIMPSRSIGPQRLSLGNAAMMHPHHGSQLPVTPLQLPALQTGNLCTAALAATRSKRSGASAPRVCLSYRNSTHFPFGPFQGPIYPKGVVIESLGPKAYIY